MNRIRLPSLGAKGGNARLTRACLLAGMIQILPLRHVRAQDRAGAEYLWYAETGGRIKVSGPSVFSETEITPWLNLRLEGVYNAVSGATPTGEPQGRRTITVQVPEVVTVNGTVAKTIFHTVTGPSGRNPQVVPETISVPGTTSSTVTRKETIVVADHKHLPVQEIHDEREGVNGLLSAKWGPGVLSAGFAYSTERDYISRAGSLKWTEEFNNKNTVANAGFAYAHDTVDLFTRPGLSAPKDSFDWHVGLSQILDRSTVADLDASFSTESGYLDDPYRIYLLDGVLVPEHRPSAKQRGTVSVNVRHYFAPVGGSVTAEYRIGADTFGVTSHTGSVAWSQKLGEAWTLRVGGRAYSQSAADFYGVSSSGRPDYYSADYRLSALYSLSADVELTWKVRDNCSINVSYERYAMFGRDGVTSPEAYPTANVFSAGVQLWF